MHDKVACDNVVSANDGVCVTVVCDKTWCVCDKVVCERLCVKDGA